MIRLEAVYVLAGLLFAAYAAFSLLDRTHPTRLRNALFWGLLAVSFLAGSWIGNLGNGVLVLALGAVAGLGKLGRGDPSATTTPQARAADAARFGDKLFLFALIVPTTVLVGALWLKDVRIGGAALIDPKQASVISLALGVIVALAIALPVLRPPLSAPVQEGRRLMDLVGWAAILPQALAALGAVFALAGVGHAVGELIGRWLPSDSRFAAVAAYTVGMALLTMITGNAFAAFPVLTAGIGLPLVVHRFGGDPAIMGALGMLAGFCGTLVTPLAANFNLVPVALLELPDRWAVIRVQAPTAVLLLIVDTALMYALVFRF